MGDIEKNQNKLNFLNKNFINDFCYILTKVFKVID